MPRLLLALLLLPLAGYASVPPPASTLEVVRQSLQQGGYLLATVPLSSTVTLGGQTVPVIPDGQGRAHILLGFDRFEPATRWLKVCSAPAVCTSKKLTIATRTYATQNVRGAPKAKVEPDAAALKRMAADNRAIGVARSVAVANAADNDGFRQIFKKPSVGPTSGVYGSRRLFDGKERSWHKGHDYAAPTGTPVYAPASGTVRLARDTFMNGNLVMIDHGARLTSVYAHLNKIAVRDGQQVQVGDKLGEVGSTGRSSGPHLHWGMYVNGVAIDPVLWLQD